MSLFPADIQKFCSVVQKRLLDEIVDRDVEKGKGSLQVETSLFLTLNFSGGRLRDGPT